jgi:hypothetical protein
MNVQVKSGIAICLVGSALFISGCGDDDVVSGPSGRLTQGPVGGATIFADKVSGGTRFSVDAGEIQTTTNATKGLFTLPRRPDYAYILVSSGGTDQLTHQTAMQLIAPSGSANVTPLTTLVALDTTGLVKAKIEALGNSFDVDISQNATPATLNLSKSVETVVAAIGATISSAATAGGTAVNATQLATIKTQTMQSLALSLGATAQDLSKPAALNTAMTTAVTAAIIGINATNTNIVLPLGQAGTIATNAVTASTTAVLGASAVGSSTSASTTTTVVENTVINDTTAATLTLAVSTTATTVSATTTATTTPVDYTPPPISVVTPPTSTGSTGSTGQIF